MNRFGLLMLAVILVLSGCGESSPQTTEPVTPEWIQVSESELSEPELEQQRRAYQAQQMMAQSMMGELKAELESGGAPGAVVVCRDLAPMIAEHVADEEGVRIGRSSHRLRNPANTAPEWAAESIAKRASDAVYFRGPDGEFAALVPIMTAKPCLACHGDRESLDTEVTAALAENYPDDRAVGFAEGDLRGWFWIEVPAAS
jgi:hypothetical protein